MCECIVVNSESMDKLFAEKYGYGMRDYLPVITPGRRKQRTRYSQNSTYYESLKKRIHTPWILFLMTILSIPPPTSRRKKQTKTGKKSEAKSRSPTFRRRN